MNCPKCGSRMNHHADKPDYGTGIAPAGAIEQDLGGVLFEVHTCMNCSHIEMRRPAE
jgi:hypothetical protein